MDKHCLNKAECRNIIKVWDPRLQDSVKTLKLSKDLQALLYHPASNCIITATGKVQGSFSLS